MRSALASTDRRPSDSTSAAFPAPPSDAGFLLLGAIVAIALVMLALAIAAPVVARSLRRDREVETVHRGQQYIRAIQLYYRKFGHYPGTIDQLENSNNIRFLRKRYTDPVTGKDDFTTIPVGQNKTTVKTFFGQPLAGLPTTGIAGASAPGTPVAGGAAAAGGAATSGGAFGSSPTSGFGSGPSFGPSPTSGFGNSSNTASPTATGAAGTASPTDPTASGATPAAGASTAAGATGTGTTPGSPAGTVGSQSATTFSGSAQPFMGVSLGAHGDSIVEYNQQTTLETWEFLYDPRLDALKARAAGLNGGGPGTIPGSSIGSPASGSFGQPGAASPFGSSSPTSGTPPGTTPTGSSPTAPPNGTATPNQP